MFLYRYNIALLRFLYLLLIIFSTTDHSFAQKEGNIWYFGNRAAIDFNGDFPYPLTNSMMNAPAGCATMCDSSGQLLFYTNGSKVWNKNHDIMMHGASLFGDSTATQSATILQHPDDSTKYYIFTNRLYPGPDSSYFGGHFYLVDFSNNSLGRIRLDQSSKSIEDGITPMATEKFMAIPYGAMTVGANGKKGFWIITHQINSNTFSVFQLDSTLRFFNTQDKGSNNSTSTAGYMKANLKGTQFALACWKWVQIFEFSRRTGKITYRYHLYGDSPNNRNHYVYHVYGLEYSPSGRFLYGTGQEGGVIYRWDMSRTNSRDIRKSTKFLRRNTESPSGALQLAPDGKIYVALKDQDYLGVINAPEQNFPDYEETGVRLVDNHTGEVGICGLGLPVNLPFSWRPPPFYVRYTCLNEPSLFYFADTVQLDSLPYWNIYKARSQTPIATVQSTGEFNAWFSFPDTGLYKVVMHASYNGNEVEYMKDVRIYGTQPINWVDTTLFCSGNDLVLDAGFGAFYEWDDTDERDRIRTVEEQEYLLQEYRVKVKDYHGCVAWDTIQVLKKYSPDILRIETEKALCGAENGSAAIYPVGRIEDFNYLWEEDSTELSNSLTNIRGGIYHVHVINPKTTCARITAITVPELGGADVQIMASTDTIVCPGTPVTLTAINADAYEWVNPAGYTSNQVTVAPYSDTIYTVRAFSQDNEGHQCITFADFRLQVYPITYPDLGPDRSACEGDSISLDINGDYIEWNWSNGFDGKSQVLRESYNRLILEVSDYNGCVTSDTMSIEFYPPPQLSISSNKALCGELNGSATVTPDGITEDYLYIWEADSTAKGNTLSGIGAGLYIVDVISLSTGCSSRAEIVVGELGGPDTQIIPSIDSTVCPGTPVTLTAINADFFEWINPAGITNSEITVYPENVMTYTVKGISRDEEGNECSTYTDLTVKVYTVNKPDLGPDLSACEGDSLWIDAGAEYDSYSWSNDSSSQILLATSSINPLFLTAFDHHSCPSFDTIAVIFHPYPDVDLGDDQTLCTNQPLTLAGGSGDYYLWSNGSVDQTIEIEQSGDYSLQISTAGCNNSDTISIILINPDEIIIDSVSHKDVTCFGGSDGEIKVYGHGPGKVYGYSIHGDQDYELNDGLFTNLSAANNYSLWVQEDSICAKEYTEPLSIKEADSIYLNYRIKPPSCASCADGQITLKEIGGGHAPYTIQWSDLGQGMSRVNLSEGIYAVTINDSLYCHRTIPILLEDIFSIPNAFTPNGDGYNDSWKIPVLRDYPQAKVWVFDRLGILVFESAAGYPVPWDGKYQDALLPMGSYYFVIKYLDSVKPITGDLTIIR